jgi:hypothetical protein
MYYPQTFVYADKCSSLLQKFVTYNSKKFDNIDSRSVKSDCFEQLVSPRVSGNLFANQVSI